jgi:hypothetical protein
MLEVKIQAMPVSEEDDDEQRLFSRRNQTPTRLVFFSFLRRFDYVYGFGDASMAFWRIKERQR